MNDSSDDDEDVDPEDPAVAKHVNSETEKQKKDVPTLVARTQLLARPAFFHYYIP